MTGALVAIEVVYALPDRQTLLTVRVSYEGAAPGAVLCRFRPRADIEERFFEFGDTVAVNELSVHASSYPERSFWYQLGWTIEGVSQTIYEPWVEVRRR